MSDDKDEKQVLTEQQYEDLMDKLSGYEQSERGGRTIYANPGIDCMNPRCPHGQFDALVASDIGWMEFTAKGPMSMCMCEVETQEGRRKLIFLHEIEP